MAIFSSPIVLIDSAAYLALLMLIGYTILCAARGTGAGHWLELLGFSFALGSGVFSLLLFAISIAGCKPSRAILVATAIIAVIAFLAMLKSRRLITPSVPSPRNRIDPLTLLGLGGLALIVAAICNVVSRAGWHGLSDIDAFAIWMFKAKIVALSPLRPIPMALRLPALSYSHQDYPLSLPLLVAGLYAALGHINDEQAKILLLPIYLSLIAIVYSAIRRWHRRATALVITAIFAAAPTLTQNAGILVAETPLLLAWTGAVVCFVRWIETEQRGDLLLCGIFAAISAFTKNEGLALLPVLGVLSLLIALRRNAMRREDAKTPRKEKQSDLYPSRFRVLAVNDWILSTAVSLALITPWLIYRIFLPKTHEDYGSKLTDPASVLHNLARLSYILPQFLGRLFDGPEVGILWYLLVLIAILGFRGINRLPVITLWVLLVIQLSLYVATFIVTPWDLHDLIPMIGPKLLTQASPLAALLIAQHLRQIRSRLSA